MWQKKIFGKDFCCANPVSLNSSSSEICPVNRANKFCNLLIIIINSVSFTNILLCQLVFSLVGLNFSTRADPDKLRDHPSNLSVLTSVKCSTAYMWTRVYVCKIISLLTEASLAALLTGQNPIQTTITTKINRHRTGSVNQFGAEKLAQFIRL